jgi:hypothetical protein
MNSLQWVLIAFRREHNVHVLLLHKYRYRPQTEQDESMCHENIIYIQTVQYWGKNRTLRNPCCWFSWHRKFTFSQDFKFSVSEKEAISLMRLVNNTNSHNLYSRPERHVALKTTSISKNTAAINILLLKFRVIRFASLIYWSIVLWSARKPNWVAFSKFLS